MTSYQLYCNFQMAKKKADELDRIAYEMRKLATQKFEDNLNSLKECWTGDSANVYIKKGNDLQSQIKAISDSLENTAATIRRVAERIYKTEIKALEIAKKRTYK